MQAKIKGVVATPVTAFTVDNRLDRATMERLIDFLIQNGAQFVGVPMHIGESLNLTLDERNELTEIAVATAARRVPVIINVSLSSTDQVLLLARHAQKAGADAVIVLPPYHWAPPKKALLEHFAQVAEAIDIGFLAYNFPRKVGVAITTDMIAELIERLPNFIGMKDATYDMQYFTEVCRLTSELRPSFGAFVGVEYMLPSMAVGGAGSFSACGAIAPRAVQALYEACARRDYETALKLQYKLSGIWNGLADGYPATVKAAMGIMGRPVGLPRMPILALEPDAIKRLEKRLAALGVLDDEPFGWNMTPAKRVASA